MSYASDSSNDSSSDSDNIETTAKKKPRKKKHKMIKINKYRKFGFLSQNGKICK